EVARLEENSEVAISAESLENARPGNERAPALLRGGGGRFAVGGQRLQALRELLAACLQCPVLFRRELELPVQATKLVLGRRDVALAFGELLLERVDARLDLREVLFALLVGGRFLSRKSRRDAEPRREQHRDGRSVPTHHSDFPAPSGTGFAPRSERTDAVTSAIPGTGLARKGLDANRIPRTRSGSSEQWSPDQT